MKAIGILLLFCSIYGALTQMRERLTSQEPGELNSFKVGEKTTTRFLDGIACLNGTIVQNQCICYDGYFDEKCGTHATRIDLNANTNGMLSKEGGEVYFFIDLSREDQEPTLTFQYLPASVQVTLALISPAYNLLPRNMTFATYNSTGQGLWDIYLSFKKDRLSSTNRLFIFVTANGDLGSDKNFRVKLTNETSHTLTIILIVVGAISVVLNIVGCVYFVKYKMRREIQAALRARLERAALFANNNQNNFDHHHRHRIDLDSEEAALTQEDLNLYFPEVEFEKLESAFGQTDCPICLEEFKTEMTCRQLYCDHIFHTKCIQFWLAKQKACPTCKKSMSRKAIAEHYLIFKKKDKPEGIESDEQKPLELGDLPVANAVESEEQQPLDPAEQPLTNAIELDEQQPSEHAEQPLADQKPSEPIELPRGEPIENQIIIIKPNEEKGESNV